MTNCRCTIKCPTLAQFPAKGISPDEMKTMKESDILNQQVINSKFNGRANELGDILKSKLTNVDISWLDNGCLVISCSNTLAEMEKVIADENLEIQPDRSDITHKSRELPDKTHAEDIDVVFEPLTDGETKKLKEIQAVNSFKEVV